MKKLKWAVVAAIVLAIVSTLIFFVIQKLKSDKFDQINLLMQELQNRYDVDLVFYGKSEPPSYCDFKYRMVDHISEETLSGTISGNCYHIVAMTDLFAPLDVSEGELLLIKRLCEEKGYAFCYAGKDSRDLMKKCGFWSYYTAAECGFSYSGYRVPKEIREGEYDENYYLASNFFEEDLQGSKLDVWLNFLFAIETQLDIDLTDGNGLISVWN